MMYELDRVLGYTDPESLLPTIGEGSSPTFDDGDASGVRLRAAPRSTRSLPPWQQALVAVSRWLVVRS